MHGNRCGEAGSPESVWSAIVTLTKKSVFAIVCGFQPVVGWLHCFWTFGAAVVEACGVVELLLLWPVMEKEEEGAGFPLGPTLCKSHHFRTEGLGPSFEHMGLWGTFQIRCRNGGRNPFAFSTPFLTSLGFNFSL